MTRRNSNKVDSGDETPRNSYPNNTMDNSRVEHGAGKPKVVNVKPAMDEASLNNRDAKRDRDLDDKGPSVKDTSVQWSKRSSRDGDSHVQILSRDAKGGHRDEMDMVPVHDQGLPKMCSGKRCHLLLFLFLVLVDVADFVSDWLFYADVKLATQGLVYGPVEPAVVHALLAFSIVGTVTFFVEVVNLYREMYKDTVYVDSDLLSAIVVWIEDVPQIILSLLIALCREEPISVFQLTKAAVVLFTVVVRIIICCVKYCNKEARRSHYHVPYKVLIFLGVLLEAGCAGAIFFLTNTERTEEGSVNFRVPRTLVRDEFNYQRYFAGVAVFVHQHDIFDKGQLNTDPDDLKVNWLRLAWLDDIRENETVYFRYDYQNVTSDSYKLAVWDRKRDRNAKWSLLECYTITTQNGSLIDQTLSKCTSSGFMTNPTSVIFTFHFTPPATLFKRRVLGHIVFNVKTGQNNKCKNVPPGAVVDTVENKAGQSATFVVHFYRTGSDIDLHEARHMNKKNQSSIAFYRNDGKTLVDVKDAWQTGWKQCAMNGYVGPPMDSGLDVPCAA